jgi:hypothetical protein
MLVKANSYTLKREVFGYEKTADYNFGGLTDSCT